MMPTRGAGVGALLALAVVLAGCSDGGGGGGAGGGGGCDPTVDETCGISSDKGAIRGILVDDRFRPVAGGTILLRQDDTGFADTQTTNPDGEFSFLDLDPGLYVARASAEGHEAAAITVTVQADRYADLDIGMQRLLSEGSRIVTREYSVFIPCAVDFVVDGLVFDCTGDASGDSFRATFEADYRDYENVTYLVTEMLANKEDRYEIQIRDGTDCSSTTFRRYSVAQFEGSYVKMVMKLNETDHEHEAVASYGENSPWANDCPLQTILFSDSVGREELQGAGAPVCCGAGAHVGIRAKFVASLFIGEPEVSIEDYETLRPEGQGGRRREPHPPGNPS